MARDAASALVASIYSAKSARTKTAIRQSPEDVFEQCLLRIVRPGDCVLDAGCGAGKFFRANFAERIPCRWIGVDVQPELSRNRRLQLRAQGEVTRLPFADGTVDVVICRWVIEHLQEPSRALAEFSRVAKPSGQLALFTSNLLHYYGAAAKLTPHRFHLWFNHRVRGFDDADIFPTAYRANTTRRLRHLLADAGFSRIEVAAVEGAPAVLDFNPLLFRAGKLYAFVVNRFDWLSAFRMNLIAIASKK
jgi:ubiquinone/menaquinone biosynthesis C-methylase UbiE